MRMLCPIRRSLGSHSAYTANTAYTAYTACALRGSIMIDAWLLFGHVIGVVVLVAGIGLEVYAVAAANRAATVAELRLAIRPARVLPVLIPLATLLMTGCGLTLVAHDPDFRFGDAWVVAAIGIVVAVSVVG